MQLRLTVQPTTVTLEPHSERSASDASRRWRERTSLWVVVEHGGVCGVGEASPLLGRSMDSLARAQAALGSAASVAGDGKRLELPNDILTCAEHEAAWRAVSCLPVLASGSAQFAVEVAVLDWLAQWQKRPLHMLFAELVAHEMQQHVVQGCAALVLEPVEQVQLAALVSTERTSLWCSEASMLVKRGFCAAKFKLGRTVNDEIQALLQVQQANPTLRLRGDFNRTLTPQAWSHASSLLSELNLEFVEEPCARWSDAVASRVTKQQGVTPLALDESLIEGPTWVQAVQRRESHTLVLKPTVLGGVRASARVLRRALLHRRDANDRLRVVVSHAFEGPVAWAAQLELLLALTTQPRLRVLAAGLSGHAGVEAYTRGCKESVDWPHALGGAGLGAHVAKPHALAGHGVRLHPFVSQTSLFPLHTGLRPTMESKPT